MRGLSYVQVMGGGRAEGLQPSSRRWEGVRSGRGLRAMFSLRRGELLSD